ncbi:hypothetical protein [Sebaldella sp. S0638]|uniref:hypothetical protein n=1 Tax=Sebaldella sp. S0638 TaxID=2957809 RepID=UPI00209EE609|nr:hypothetical protein [Sebaldella sp. S0638]MCP1225677.1 hypothetical protein [Sebaldella sp. S0638]
MNYLNLVTGFYMQHPYINTSIVIGLVAIGFFVYKYKKAEVLAFVASKWAEAMGGDKGVEKLNYAVDWMMRQEFYKNSVLCIIPKNWIKSLIQHVFNKNKNIIESK